jgi:diaminopimelate decarboxylase
LTTHHKQHSLSFSNDSQIVELAKKYGTPLLVHDEDSYRRYAKSALSTPNAFGLTVRYAMKANSHRAILRIFGGMGILIDASSLQGKAIRMKSIPFNCRKLKLEIILW